MNIISKLIGLLVLGLLLASCSSSPAPVLPGAKPYLFLQPSPLEVQWTPTQDFSQQACAQLFVQDGDTTIKVTSKNGRIDGGRTMWSNVPHPDSTNFTTYDDETSSVICFVAFNEASGNYRVPAGVSVQGYGELTGELSFKVSR
jgi:hypothetical protein